MINVRVLASSSAGNCTLIRANRTALLIDCGLGPGRLRLLLEESGLRLGDLAGVLLTHTHGDHLHRDMAGALRNAGVPLYCTPAVADVLGGQMDLFTSREIPPVKTFTRSTVRIGGLEAEVFPVPHDAPGGCSGFLVRREGKRLHRTVAFATDIGHVDPGLPGRLSEADLLIVESNHDIGLLLRSGRPEWLIRRIRTLGHLSNEESGTLIQDAISARASRVRRVVLAHLSEQCNTAAIALRTVRALLPDPASRGLHVETAPARTPMATIEL